LMATVTWTRAILPHLQQSSGVLIARSVHSVSHRVAGLLLPGRLTACRLVVPIKQCGSIISISYISCLLAAHGEKPGVYKVKQGSILKPALLCRDYRCFMV
jgi:hypothetical protein